MLEWGNGEVTKKKMLFRDFQEEVYRFFSKEDNMIFKGASLLYLISEPLESPVLRQTKDIDFSVLDFDKEKCKELCRLFYEELDKKYDLSGFVTGEDERTESMNTAYIFNFYDKEKLDNSKTKKEVFRSIVFNIDFSSSDYYNQDTRYFYFNIEGGFRGYNINKIYSDKMINISTRRIFSRNKDLIDLFILSFNDKFDIRTKEIDYFNKLKTEATLEDFKYLFENREDIKNVMKGLRGLSIKIGGEGNYDYILDRVTDFVAPYIPGFNRCISVDMIWDPKNGVWKPLKRED